MNQKSLIFGGQRKCSETARRLLCWKCEGCDWSNREKLVQIQYFPCCMKCAYDWLSFTEKQLNN